MSTNMTGGADGGIAIQVKLDTSKASKELTRLEQKILKLQEEVTVGKAKKSALVAQLEQANAELTALQAKTKIDGKSFVISPEDSKRISDLKIQIEQTQTAIEQQNKALSDAQLTLEGVKTRYGEVTQQAQALAAAEQETAGGSMQEAREHVEQTADAFAQAQWNAEELNDTMDGTQGSASRMEKAAMKVQKSMERIAKRIKSLFGQALFFGLISRALSSFRDWLGETIRQNDAATAAVSRLKGALLTLAQPILGVVLPAFTALVDALTRIVTMVAEFISILTGTSFSASKDAAKNLNEEKKALDGVGAAAASAEKSMAGFDEINKLTANNASGGGGGASSGIAAEFDSLTSTLPKWLANLAKALHDFAEDIVIKIRELKFEWDKGNILKSKDAWVVMLSGILGAVIGAAIGGVFGGIVGGIVGISLGLAIHWSSITYDEVPKRTAGGGFSGGGGFGSRTSRAAYQSLQVPPVSSVDLPRLASGAVIPPNREFLAVLGDQRQGMNIEAPAEMIRQMVADGIRAAGIGSGSRPQTVILQVGRRELGRVVYELNKEETQRVGVQLASVKA